VATQLDQRYIFANEQAMIEEGYNDYSLHWMYEGMVRDIPVDGDRFFYKGMRLFPKTLEETVRNGLKPNGSGYGVIFLKDFPKLCAEYAFWPNRNRRTTYDPHYPVINFAPVILQIDKTRDPDLAKEKTSAKFDKPIPADWITGVYVFDREKKVFVDLKSSFILPETKAVSNTGTGGKVSLSIESAALGKFSVSVIAKSNLEIPSFKDFLVDLAEGKDELRVVDLACGGYPNFAYGLQKILHRAGVKAKIRSINADTNHPELVLKMDMAHLTRAKRCVLEAQGIGPGTQDLVVINNILDARLIRQGLWMLKPGGALWVTFNKLDYDCEIPQVLHIVGSVDQSDFRHRYNAYFPVSKPRDYLLVNNGQYTAISQMLVVVKIIQVSSSIRNLKRCAAVIALCFIAALLLPSLAAVAFGQLGGVGITASSLLAAVADHESASSGDVIGSLVSTFRDREHRNQRMALARKLLDQGAEGVALLRRVSEAIAWQPAEPVVDKYGQGVYAGMGTQTETLFEALPPLCYLSEGAFVQAAQHGDTAVLHFREGKVVDVNGDTNLEHNSWAKGNIIFNNEVFPILDDVYLVAKSTPGKKKYLTSVGFILNDVYWCGYNLRGMVFRYYRDFDVYFMGRHSNLGYILDQAQMDFDNVDWRDVFNGEKESLNKRALLARADQMLSGNLERFPLEFMQRVMPEHYGSSGGSTLRTSLDSAAADRMARDASAALLVAQTRLSRVGVSLSGGDCAVNPFIWYLHKKLAPNGYKVFGVMNGFGIRYITPYALALGASNTIIGLLSSLPSFLGTLSQIQSSKLIEKVKRKKIVVYSVALQALMWLPLIFIGVLYFFFGVNSLISSLLLLFIYSLLILAGSFCNPAWSSWMKDIVTKNTDTYFARRNMIAGTIGLSSALIAGFMLDFFNKYNALLGFWIIFSIALL